MPNFKLLRGVLLAISLVQGVHAAPTTYAAVTDERLQHPEAGDWLMYRRTYDGFGFSPLSQINAGNVAKLSLA